jgi:peptide chain release factor
MAFCDLTTAGIRGIFDHVSNATISLLLRNLADTKKQRIIFSILDSNMSSSLTSNRLSIANRRLSKLGIREEDLSEQFIHAGGKGGQNVNKVSTAVRLRHNPTGEEVKCMEERFQFLNRIRAREILAERLEKKRELSRLAAKAAAEKLRRHKAGRPKSIKKQMVKEKRKKGEVKKGRSWRYSGDD